MINDDKSNHWERYIAFSNDVWVFPFWNELEFIRIIKDKNKHQHDCVSLTNCNKQQAVLHETVPSTEHSNYVMMMVEVYIKILRFWEFCNIYLENNVKNDFYVHILLNAMIIFLWKNVFQAYNIPCKTRQVTTEP